MKKLIINADDFALHELVNQAIEQSHREGVLTSATLLACGEAFESAVAIAERNPDLGVGVHLCLVGGLAPVSPVERVASLLDPTTGRFYENYVVFVKKYLRGAVSLQEVALELEAQFLKIKNAGVNITHIDSHQHLHMLPGVTEIAMDICKKNNLYKSRASQERLFFTGGYPYTYGRYVGKVVLSVLSGWARLKLCRQGFKCPQNFFGMLAGGNMREEYLLNILRKLPTGTTEIMMHPGLEERALAACFGFEYNWQKEYQALLSGEVKKQICNSGVQLISFKDL